MKLAGRRGVVKAQSCRVAGRQTQRVECRAAAARRRLARGVLLDTVGQSVAPQLEAGAALGDDDVQSRSAQRVDDDDRHSGRRVPPTRRTAAAAAGCAGEVEQSGARADVNERQATAIEQIDLEQFGVRQQRAALSLVDDRATSSRPIAVATAHRRASSVTVDVISTFLTTLRRLTGDGD